jgi:mono/diheme cytochrome c family protein
MRISLRGRTCRTTPLLLAGCLALAPAHAAEPSPAPDGRALYLASCAPCHGENGRGDGPEAMSFKPAPRDLKGGFLDTLSEDRVVARLRDGTPLVLEPGALKTRLGGLEDVSAHIQRLPSIDWTKVDAGAALFAARCAVCHGPFGKPLPSSSLPPGVQKQPRNFWDPQFQRTTSDAQLIAAMQHGQRAMPAIPAVSDTQARQLVVFIRLLSPAFETYSLYCAPCHGDDGRGNGVLATGKNKPRVAFDADWLARKDPEQLRVDVAHMIAAHGATMPHLRGTLSDEQMHAIVRYLKGAS